MQDTQVSPLVLDRQEAADALRISLRKLDYLIARGEVRATRIDTRVLVSWNELTRFVAAKTVTAPELVPA